MRVIACFTFLFVLAVAYSEYEPMMRIVCPDDNSENATLLANPYNCNTYFACESGIPIPMKCPDGLHFNAELGVCDWPNKANCKPISLDA